MNNISSYRQIVLQNLFTTGERLVKEMIIDRRQIKSIRFDGNELTNDKKDIRVHFDNAIIFPGLVNSHDHLDFDLFPKLGNKAYEDYIEWGNDIHKTNKAAINNVLKIPRSLRVQWGIYKNLLAGITTVVHHGEYVQEKNDGTDVYQKCNMLHSVQLEKHLKFKLNNPFAKRLPCVIHIGEGTNKKSTEEIDKLIKWNLFKRKLIGIHGIALNEQQAKFFEALIWCPDSNLFLQHKTAAVGKLKKYTRILFGTDSTLSADWNIWNQLRIARNLNLLSDEELFASLTSKAAEIWNIHAGTLEEKMNADIVIAEKRSANAMDAFFQVNPEFILMVMKTGNIVLFDESLLTQLKSQQIDLEDFSAIQINGKCKYIKGHIKDLIKQIKAYARDISFPIEIS